MRRKLTKGEAQAFRKRWNTVNEAERKELRETSAVNKLRQRAALMGSVRQLGWTRLLEEEEAAVRDRWNRLREVYGRRRSKG